MNNNFNIKILEEIFSEDFSSPAYAMLVDEYLKLGDLDRASTVCNIGLENNPEDLSGQYLLAKIYFLQNKALESKEILNQILNQFPIHLNARQLLIKIIKEQDGRVSELLPNVEKLQEFFPNIGGVSSSEPNSKEPVLADKKSEEQTHDINDKKSRPKESFKVSKNMATFTFVDILLDQKHYSEALDILDLLERNGKQKTKIKKKREQIKKAMGK